MVESVTWSGTIKLRVTSYVRPLMPPDELITSARVVLLTKDGFAMLRNADVPHILPGGRREPSESVMDALRREALEEIGCEMKKAELLGFMHFHHLTPRPSGYVSPYPDFLHVVFAARGRVAIADSVDPDGWEQSVEFVPLAELESRPLRATERLFLDAAVVALEVA